jgi:hypothetical protein
MYTRDRHADQAAEDWNGDTGEFKWAARVRKRSGKFAARTLVAEGLRRIGRGEGGGDGRTVGANA